MDYKDDAQLIASKWKLGEVKVLPAMTGSIRYTLKYMMKQQHGQQAIELYDNQGLERPFGHMSKGLGREYLAKKIEEIKEKGGYYVRGKIRPMPEYYKRLLLQSDVTSSQDLKKRITKARNAGYEDVETWQKATGKLKEMHLIKNARARRNPIDSYYLANYEEPKDYKTILKEIQNFEQNYLCN